MEIEETDWHRSRVELRYTRSKFRHDSLRTQAQSLVSVLWPVFACILLVLWAVHLVSPTLFSSNEQRSGFTVVYQEKETDSTSDRLSGSLLNALVIVGFVVLVTFVLLILYKLRCVWLVYGWLLCSTILMVVMFGFFWLYVCLQVYEIQMDYFTFCLILANFTVVGIVSLLYVSSLTMARFYMILLSAMVSWWFCRIPEWTTWMLVTLLAIYDLIAVLSPKGPLRVLVETAQERNERLPAFVYQGDDIQLGLGDFIFYSVLVGRAALVDTSTVFLVSIAVMMGLVSTIFILTLVRKALPALPISIALGLLVFFIARFTFSDFSLNMSSHLVSF